jgi:rRNA maturation endonuclease Nob1
LIWVFFLSFTLLVAIFFYFLNLSLRKHYEIHGTKFIRPSMCVACGKEFLNGSSNFCESCKSKRAAK